MVNIVINKEKKRVKANDIDKGIIISKEYYCICCDSRMIYVKGSEYEDKYGNKITRESHFKHKNSKIENECKNNKYNGYTKKDMENEYNNEKSDFHKYWQDMFDTDNLEHKIMENNKIHYADIYIECDDKIDLKINNVEESILSNYLPNKLVIEIQHSKISLEKMIERTNFYHKNDLNREIIWIFDLQKKVKKIEKIITYNETKYRLKLMNQNEHDFQELFKITDYKPIVILDNNGNMLYYIKDIPKFDIDYLDVIGIRRDDFLNQLGKYVNKELLYNGKIVKDTVKIIDYESAVINLKNVNEENKNRIRYIFYIMEYISYNELRGKECYSLLDTIYMYLMFYSKKSEKIKSMFKIFLERNRGVYKNRLNFGKDCGKEMNEVSYNYLYWVFKEFKLDNIIFYYKEGDDIDDCLRCVNIDDWKERKIRQDVELYENIHDYVKENIEYYNGLEGEDWFVINEDYLNVYEYLDLKLCLVEKKIYENKYKNLLLPINNDVINKRYEKHLFIKSACNNIDNICNFCKRDGYNKYGLNICGICECKTKEELIDMLKNDNQEKYIKEREERMKLEEEKRKVEEEKRKVEEEKRKVEEEKKKMEEILNRERILMYNEEMYERKRLNKIKEEEMYERDRLNKIKREEEIKKAMEELKKKNDYDDWIKEEKRRKEEKLYKFNVIHYYQHNISGRINPVQQRLKKCKSLKECMIYLKSKIVHEDIKEHTIKKIEIKVYSKVMYKFNNVEECDVWLMSGNMNDNKELDLFVREKLGQIEFENIADGTEHKRLDFDARNEENIINNKEIINIFSEYYNDKGVIINSCKGSLRYYIIEKEHSNNDENWYDLKDKYIKCKRIDGGEMGTVDIIKDIIYEINKI